MKSKRTFVKLLSALIALLMVFSSIGFAASAEESIGTAKNVILFIGDGMGVNTLEWTKAELDVDLFMDTMPYKGLSQTDSRNGTTDSAAGATALACGKTVYNSNLGTLSVLIDGNGATVSSYMNVSEVAKKLGKKAGIVTSDENSGATPAGFSVHTYKRTLSEEITLQQMNCGLDLIWAANNGISVKEDFENAGWTYSSTMLELQKLEDDKPSFAAIDGPIYYETGSKADAPLSALTTMAIKRLDNEDGFFLMVEGAHIDKNSHANNKEQMMKAVLEFDKAIANAVKFAEEDGNTIVIVTADHETGGITFNEEKGEYEYTLTGHSGADVPLLVYGSDELVKDGVAVKNTTVATFIAGKLGYTEKFPDGKYNFLFPFALIGALVKSIFT